MHRSFVTAVDENDQACGYATDFNNSSSAKQSSPNQAYDGGRTGLAAAFATYKFGDPSATAVAILAVVDADMPPLRIALGAGTIDQIEGSYRERLATWDAWKSVSVAAGVNPPELAHEC